MIGSNNPAFKNGKPKCLDCGKQLAIYTAKRCRKCAKQGKLHPQFNKPRLEETKRKLSILNSGKNHPMYGTKRLEHSINMQGSGNPRWIDGRSYEDYPKEFNESLREEIRERDNYICQNKECNMTQEEHFIIYGSNIEVHHIDYNKQNCDKTNLVTTCKQCNLRANINRDYWRNYYSNVIERKIYV
jgi:hypothetical protein